jgi:hypothetical protein
MEDTLYLQRAKFCAVIKGATACPALNSDDLISSPVKWVAEKFLQG